MAFFDDLTKMAKDVATVAADKTKDAAEQVKLSVAIAGEQKEIDKNYRTIGEWFGTEFRETSSRKLRVRRQDRTSLQAG